MKATLTVLGSGTSMGVPTIGCDCAVCTSSDPHDRRLRPSIMVQWDGHTVLIDTSPDFREQAIREHITRVDAVLYTHGHADHILGLDDVRPLSFPRVTGGGKIPLYATENTAKVLRSVFRYIFEGDYKYGGLAQVEIRNVDGPIELFGATFKPLVVNHGDYPIEAYRFGSAAYLTDFSTVPDETLAQLRRSRHSVSRCAAASSASHAFDAGELAADRGASQAEARILHPHVARHAARGDECLAAGERAPLL